MMRLRLLTIGFIPALLLCFYSCPKSLSQEDRIEIAAERLSAFDPLNPSERYFGALEFRGGLILTSTYKLFGGISALSVHPDGSRFLALTDAGSWLRGRIVYEGKQPVAVADAAITPVLGPDGKPAETWDTESLARDGSTLYVGIERINTIMRFAYGKNGRLAAARPIAVPPAVKELPSNQGIEAMVLVPENLKLAGTIIAISEHGLDKAGNIRAFLIGGPSPGAFAINRSDGFDISDASLLPEGDLLILERRYSLETGVAFRIRCIRLAAVKPGALVDGPVIIEADARYAIDNMEAMGVHTSESGEIVLTLISDDNFSVTQRTILLQFTYLGK